MGRTCRPADPCLAAGSSRWGWRCAGGRDLAAALRWKATGGKSQKFALLSNKAYKEKADAYKQYNVGHVPDIIQPGASAWGTDTYDWIGETKVPSPLRTTPPKSQCELVEHLVAFGNTEEWLHREILGCRARGQAAILQCDLCLSVRKK